MKKTASEIGEKKLVGISVRTSYHDELSRETSKISPCVMRYFHENLFEQIPNRKSPGATYCAYTDYESGFQGAYTYFIGEEVSGTERPLPEGFQAIEIPRQTYAIFTTEPAPMPDVVVKAWKTIWNLTPAELGGRRSYKTDFEIYDERAADHQNVVLDVCIGIAPN